MLTARVDARSSARVGSMLALAVDPSRFHFFDATTGEGLSKSAAVAVEPVPAEPMR
jgi:hypothetical protein